MFVLFEALEPESQLPGACGSRLEPVSAPANPWGRLLGQRKGLKTLHVQRPHREIPIVDLLTIRARLRTPAT